MVPRPLAVSQNLGIQVSIIQSLYLAMMDITKKWTGKAWSWGQTLDQLCIYFEDRINPEDIY